MIGASRNGWYVRVKYRSGETLNHGAWNPGTQDAAVVFAIKMLTNDDLAIQGVEILYIHAGEEAPK